MARKRGLGPFATLPIPMPRVATVWTGSDGKPVAMWCDEVRIRPCDFATVWQGIQEYNADLHHQRDDVPEEDED